MSTAASAYVSKPVMIRTARTTRKTINLSQDDLIIDILGLQRHRGGFFIDDNVAKMLNTTVDNLKDISKQIITKNTTDKFILLSTAIVLAILESKFSQKRSMWESLVQKSKKWLDLEIQQTKPVLQGVGLDKWVEDYVKENLT